MAGFLFCFYFNDFGQKWIYGHVIFSFFWCLATFSFWRNEFKILKSITHLKFERKGKNRHTWTWTFKYVNHCVLFVYVLDEEYTIIIIMGFLSGWKKVKTLDRHLSFIQHDWMICFDFCFSVSRFQLSWLHIRFSKRKEKLLFT